MDVLAYLSDIDAPNFSPRTMDTAARYTCLPILKWLHTHRNEGGTTSAMDSAAANGYLEVVQFLHLHRPEVFTTDGMGMNRAAAHGHLEAAAKSAVAPMEIPTHHVAVGCNVQFQPGSLMFAHAMQAPCASRASEHRYWIDAHRGLSLVKPTPRATVRHRFEWLQYILLFHLAAPSKACPSVVGVQ
ncbi:Aste57867_22246 [Aphanomyces stellatus]|uniref:Aste57867_22246 protein n=1 Tax=Aphanomyces stellatus TaxID=120398 RepID=A0A485LL01_9STRA|nr:hypothetical protein As57867_022177 [Aphanomyces stellatus]VFT98913.1 Aste57867_22246 [Aphanomyces stellatus]